MWNNPVFIALDTPDIEHALALAQHVQPWIGGIKLGLEFFTSQGPKGVERMAQLGLPIFLDLKLYDIPNTVAKTIQVLRGLGVAMTTIHTSGGLRMMQAAQEAATTPSVAQPPLLLLGVTVLTSMEQADLPAIGITQDVATHAAALASLADAAGLHGLVCAATDVALLRTRYPHHTLVVPGIRPVDAAAHDQKRTMPPAEALRAGANILVIGRPITEAQDPVEAAKAIAVTLAA